MKIKMKINKNINKNENVGWLSAGHWPAFGRPLAGHWPAFGAGLRPAIGRPAGRPSAQTPHPKKRDPK